jgi:hypothetical protein
MGGIGGTSRYPTVGAGIISAAGVKVDNRAAENPRPNDHLTAGPYGRVLLTG